jgi:hypothetical protein
MAQSRRERSDFAIRVRIVSAMKSASSRSSSVSMSVTGSPAGRVARSVLPRRSVFSAMTALASASTLGVER